MATKDEFQAEIKVESQRLERQLVRFAAECDKLPAEVLPQVAKSVIRDVVKVTPPLEKLSVTESWATQKKIGERAVAMDIASAFVPLDQLGIFRNPKDSVLNRVAVKALRNGGPEELADILERFGYKNVTPSRIIDEPTEELHDPLRGSRGKVLRSRRSSYYVRRTAKVKAFIRKKQKLVGKLKSGWVTAAVALGVKVPVWVSRHRQPGGFVNRSRAVWNPFIRAWNDVSYAKRQNQDLRYIAIAMRNQVGKLERQMVAKMMGKWKGRGAQMWGD